jgi:hypothetical protein
MKACRDHSPARPNYRTSGCEQLIPNGPVIIGAPCRGHPQSRRRDPDSKKVLEAILKDNPDDFSALLSLAFVCSEYLLDTECSYSQNKKLVTLNGSIDRVAILLNAAEAAVLNREYRQAATWLNEALGQADLTAKLIALPT